MANYCTLDEVRGWMPGGAAIDDQASNPPTATTVSAWITKFTGEIDSAFASAGVTAPVTDANAVAMLNTKLAREIAYQVTAVRAAAQQKDVEPLYFGWHEEYLALLVQIQESAIGSLDGGVVIPWSYTMSSTGYAPDDPLGPAFKKGREF